MPKDELNSVKVEITTGGKECDFATLDLRQTMYGHHTFRIELNYRIRERDVWTETPEQILEQLGANVSVRISERGGAETEFMGIIKKVCIGGKDSNQGSVTLYGGSPTLLMTDDYSMDSFIDTDLASIVHETISNIGLKIETRLEPSCKDEIPFVYRYKESSYDFLRRLAASYGEWFYYDGRKIVVGLPKSKEEDDISLNFKDDLFEMDISSTLGNYDIEQFDYDPLEDRIRQCISYPNGHNTDGFTTPAFGKSKAIYKDFTVLPTRSTGSTTMMINAVNAAHLSKLSGGSLFTARTNTCKAALGKVVFMQSDIHSKQSAYDRKLGRFRIIEVNHTYDRGKDKYENCITGVNASIEAVPEWEVKWPTAQPEVAKVVDNNDPKKLGRVKVKYMWQQLDDHPQHKTTAWLRVQTPDAGSSDAVDKNRGIFFIPEVGDQVMVGYEFGDPNRPFVMGSLYNVKNSRGITGENATKTIRTRSGHTLEFNDDESGEWGITIKDVEGNVMRLDTKNKNIEIMAMNDVVITARENIALNAKNISIIAREDIDTDSGNNTTLIAGKDMDMTALNLHTQATDDALYQSEKFEITSGKIRVDSVKENLELASGQDVDVQTQKKVNLF